MHLAKAIALAAEVHEEQYDLGGEPYILHCIRVMETTLRMLRDSSSSIPAAGRTAPQSAVLHDVVEDSPVETRSLVKARVLNEFGPVVYKTVDILTKKKGEDYLQSYIPRVLTDEDAIVVKLADLHDNLNILRQPKLDNIAFLRLQKYHVAFSTLRNEWETICREDS